MSEPIGARDWRAAVKADVGDAEVFLRLTVAAPRGRDCPWRRVVVRPVTVRGRRAWQFSRYDATQCVAENVHEEALPAALDELLDLPFGSFHVQSATHDLLVRRTARGRVMVSRSRPSLDPAAIDLSHDRSKRRFLTPESAGSLLHALGILNARGRVRPEMQAKYRQVNEFLAVLDPLLRRWRSGEALEMVDCGCGNAYLTFCAHHYAREAYGLRVRTVGIDVRRDSVERSNALRDQLGWTDMEFVATAIRAYAPERPPGLTLSLHACDTATDEALALGVRSGSRAIVAAPCCQHELHERLHADAWRAVLRHGILKQRLADVVTDAFRAAVLRLLGYRTDVVEFVEPVHTTRNLILRGVRTTEPGAETPAREYGALRDLWGVEPHIARLLREQVNEALARARSAQASAPGSPP